MESGGKPRKLDERRAFLRLFADWLRGPPRKLGFNDPRYLITNKTPVTESSTSIVYASASEG